MMQLAQWLTYSKHLMSIIYHYFHLSLFTYSLSIENWELSLNFSFSIPISNQLLSLIDYTSSMSQKYIFLCLFQLPLSLFTCVSLSALFFPLPVRSLSPWPQYLAQVAPLCKFYLNVSARMRHLFHSALLASSRDFIWGT